jgi:hypothetical protein
MVLYVDGNGAERARRELTDAVPPSISVVTTARIKKPRWPQLGTVLAQPARRKA